MYLDHYGFKREPFNITPDSRFLFTSKRHSEAMGSLLYGVEGRKGFIALTGEIGSGKTTICRALLKDLGSRDDIRLALILNPQLNDLELLQAICSEFGLPDTGTKRELLQRLNEFLLREYEAGNNCVLVIDESQRLSPDTLEQVRLISNLELETTKLIQIALVGQPELDDILHLPELEQLNQRITVRCHIDPLDFDETCAYIEHRLKVAEPSKDVSFSKKALKEIFAWSGGVPRRINVVCDRALLVAFVDEKFEVSGEHARKAIEEVAGKRRQPPPTPAAAAERASTPASGPAEVAASPLPPPTGRRSQTPVLVAAVIVGAAIISGSILMRPDFEPRPVSEERLQQAAAAEDDVQIAQAEPSPTPVPTATPSPTPEPTPEATATATPAPEPTAAPAVMAEVTETPEPTPEPTPEVTAAPSPAPSPTPVPTPEPAEIADWSYSGDGIVRVERPAHSYAASVLTWLALERGERLPEEDLEALRQAPADELAEWQLTQGQAPLHLREARLPSVLPMLTDAMLPALVQLDNDAEDIAPWVVLTALHSDTAMIADPLRGEREVPRMLLEDHLAGLVVPYSDPEGITELGPQDEGDAVARLQQLLADAGVYDESPSRVFDEATSQAVLRYREQKELPGEARVDPPLALALLKETAASEAGTP